MYLKCLRFLYPTTNNLAFVNDVKWIFIFFIHLENIILWYIKALVGYPSSEVKFSCSVAYIIETFESRSQNWAGLGSKL